MERQREVPVEMIFENPKGGTSRTFLYEKNLPFPLFLVY